MIIDFHSHNFPDVIAPRAIAGMCRALEGRATACAEQVHS